MRSRLLLLLCGTAAVLTISVVNGQQTPAAPGGGAARQGGAGGRGVPPLSQTVWEPWQNPGLRALPADVSPDGPAPRRDLTGIWDSGRTGIQARGSRDNPDPRSLLTEWGRRKGDTHKSGDGIRQVDAPEINDPLSIMGDPGGYPRQLLFELRHVQFAQTPQSVLALFMWERRYRTIWTDGRQLPIDPDPRWYGYSVGRWVDDYTFVVNSNGTDDRTWLDNAGNPHSAQLKVEERWHRLSEKRLELTVTLDDPVAYTKPWVALNKIQFVQIPPTVDLMEMMNAASEVQAVAKSYKEN
jgi:hypothetical protein